MSMTSKLALAAALLCASAPAMAAPKKVPAKKAPAKGKAKSTAAEEANLEASLDPGAAAPVAPPRGPKHVAQESGAGGAEAVDLDVPAWHGLDVQLGFGVFARKLSYTDDLYKSLRPYSLPLGPVASLRANVLPLAVGESLRLGAYLRGDLAFGIESKNPAGQAFASSAGVAELALAGQMQFDALSVGLRLGYGTQWFSAESIDGATATIDPGIPSVKHTYLFGTVTGAYAVSPELDLTGALGYLSGQGAGALSSDAWFPHATSRGVDAQVGVVYKLSPSLALGAEGSYRRIAFSMNSVPGDAKVAGGATDDTPGGRAFVQLHW